MPIISAELEGGAAPAEARDGGGGGFQRRIDGAIRRALGRMPRVGDTRSFVMALRQSFECRAFGTHSEYVWTPRSFVGQTDLGGTITGRQAALYASAVADLNRCLPLLDGLYPLDPKADPQNTEALRYLVRSGITELVDALRTEGGPTIARVDDLFQRLVGSKKGFKANDPDDIVEEGLLNSFQDQFGLLKKNTKTAEEENNRTNFVSFAEFVFQTRVSWEPFRDTLSISDFGTLLVLLSRAFSVCNDTLGELVTALDAFFVGEADRQSLIITAKKANITGFDTAGKAVVTATNDVAPAFNFADLLIWTSEFTLRGGPALVQEGGKFGGIEVTSTATNLARQFDAVAKVHVEKPQAEVLGNKTLLADSIPSDLDSEWVQRPIAVLRDQLLQVARLAQTLGKS